MSEMVDRVGAAINAAITWEIASCMDEGACKPRDKSCGCTTILARAAIAAMREPTGAMCEDAAKMQGDAHHFGPGDAGLVWRDMIDAALIDK